MIQPDKVRAEANWEVVSQIAAKNIRIPISLRDYQAC